jgi:hypothetical protein
MQGYRLPCMRFPRTGLLAQALMMINLLPELARADAEQAPPKREPRPAPTFGEPVCAADLEGHVESFARATGQPVDEVRREVDKLMEPRRETLMEYAERSNANIPPGHPPFGVAATPYQVEQIKVLQQREAEQARERHIASINGGTVDLSASPPKPQQSRQTTAEDIRRAKLRADRAERRKQRIDSSDAALACIIASEKKARAKKARACRKARRGW